MKRWIKGVGVVAVIVLAAGCARLQVYKRDDLSGPETGFKFFTAKPYLLVARTGNKDKPVDVTVQYLPDVSEPLYAKAESGLFGTSNLTMTFSNGMLVSFGQTVDTKVSELLTAAGGYQKAIAEATKARSEAAAPKAQATMPDGKAPGSLANQVADLKAVSSDLKRYATDQGVRAQLTSVEIAKLQSYSTMLDEAARLLSSQNAKEVTIASAMLKNVLDDWQKAIARPVDREPARRNIEVSRAHVQAVLEDVQPKGDDVTTFTLYEIVWDKEQRITILNELLYK